jgi:hypothetical protein
MVNSSISYKYYTHYQHIKHFYFMECFHSIWPYFRIIPIQNIPYIQSGLRLYSHLFCRGFIFHYFCIYLSIMLSISSRSGTAYPSRVQDSPLSCFSILSFLSNVLYICSIVGFSFGNCIVCPSIYTI